jgi:hypothetical protein
MERIRKYLYSSFFFLILVLLACFPLIFSQSSKIDLITKASGARWKNDIGILNLPFPGKADDSRGFVRLITAQLEDGETASNVLQTHPRWAARGSIEGQYQITIPENAKFEAEVGFIQGAKATDGVIFEVVWRERGKADIILGSIEKKYTGNLSTFDIDLGNLAGQTGLFILRVRAGQSAAQDWAVWKSAAIISGMPGAASMPKAKEPIQIKQPPVKVVKPIPPEAQIRISEIEDANKKIARYRIRGHVMPSGLQFEGIVDQQKKSLYLKLNLSESPDTAAEFYRIGTNGYGRPLGSQRWFNIEGGEEFLNYLLCSIELMKQGKIISAREEQQLLTYEISFENLPLRNRLEQFFSSLFRKPVSPRMQDMISSMIEASRDLRVSTYISVFPKDKKIKKVNIETESLQMKTSFVITIDETRDEVPGCPEEALRAKGPFIPWPMLLFRLPERWGIGGWNDFIHCSLALGAIRLIQNTDKDERYAEMYRIANQECLWDSSADEFKLSDTTNHPILLGTFYEDQKSNNDEIIKFYKDWFNEEFDELGLDERFNRMARRPYMHYGGGDLGLRNEWYFEIGWSPVPERSCSGDRFYSARDWGYGGKRTGEGRCSPYVEDLNRLTFVEAIKQYNKYSIKGKKNAYLMLGHVIHLLQDQSEPDHAKLVPHPASGCSGLDAFGPHGFLTCELLAATVASLAAPACGPFAPICAAVAYADAKSACLPWMDPNMVGYEWLAEHRWTLSRIETQLRSLSPLRESDYDAFFGNMANYAIDAVERHGFSSDYDNGNSLGTATADLFYISVPACVPNINLITDGERIRRYLAMTDELAIYAIQAGAGLLQYFYEIVNPPPYLKRLTITQGSETRFDVTWDDVIEEKENRVIRREKIIRKNYTLYHGVPATITAWFGPDSIIGPDPEKDPKHVRTRDMQGGNVYIDGQRVSLSRSMEDGNPVLRGSFIPGCIREINPITTSISIDALDDAPHLQSRNPLGNSLDKDPSTVAGARAYPPHDWINYEQDSDPFHLYVPIKIGIPDALIDFVSVEGGRGFYEGYDPDLHVGAHLRAGAGEGAIVSLRLLERESGQPIITDPEQGECGYYSFYIPPTIEVIGQTTEAMVGGRVVHVPLVVSPTQVGFTIHIDGARSNQPKLHIDVDPEAQSGRYRIPLIINYEFRDGHTDQIYRLDLEFQVLNIWETDKENRANENAANLLGLKDLVRAKKLGFLDIREGPPVAFDPCKVGVSSPEWCFLRDPFQLREVRIVPDREVAFSSLTSQMRKITISAIKLNIRPDERDPHIIYFEAGPQLAPGTYLISFKVMMGNKQLDRFLVMAAVTK